MIAIRFQAGANLVHYLLKSNADGQKVVHTGFQQYRFPVCSGAGKSFLQSKFYITPCSSIARATFMKPAMFAPLT